MEKLDSIAVARRLGVSLRTIESWRRVGIGPRWQKEQVGRGGRVTYLARDVAEYKKELAKK